MYWSWWMPVRYHCRLFQVTALSNSLSWWTCLRILVQYQRCIPLGHWTVPWHWYQILVPYLGCWSASYILCTSWEWIPVSYFFHSSPLTHSLQRFGMVRLRPTSSPFLTLIFISLFVCCNICTLFVIFEILKNFLLVSLLYRQE